MLSTCYASAAASVRHAGWTGHKTIRPVETPPAVPSSSESGNTAPPNQTRATLPGADRKTIVRCRASFFFRETNHRKLGTYLKEVGGRAVMVVVMVVVAEWRKKRERKRVDI